MPHLEMKNFGPIKDFDVDPSRYMFIIGQQASGKSTICKAIFFFKKLRDEISEHISSQFHARAMPKNTEIFRKVIRERFLNFFGPAYWPKDMLLRYQYSNDAQITITSEGKFIRPKLSPLIEQSILSLYHECEEFLKSAKLKEIAPFESAINVVEQQKQRRFLSDIFEKINILFDDSFFHVYIPATRSVMTTLTDQVQEIHPHKLDYPTKSFWEFVQRLKPTFEGGLASAYERRKKLSIKQPDTARVRILEHKINNILRARYVYQENDEKIYYDDHHYVKINFGSSGQQESLWILLVLYAIVLEGIPVFLVIEEPEAHLFPNAQKEMVEAICSVASAGKNQLIITTHSPYVLSSVNNLLLAASVGKSKPNKVEPIIPRQLWLDHRLTSAYSVLDGVCTTIIDHEDEIIDPEAIDSVSDNINNIFDLLLEIEEDIREENNMSCKYSKHECSNTHKNENIVIKEKGKHLKLKNPKHKEICVVHIDGCYIKAIDIKKCDYLAYICSIKHVILIELKGKNVKRALEQILSTYEEIKKDLVGCNLTAIIIISRYSVPKITNIPVYKKLRKTIKSNPVIKTREHTIVV